MKKMKSKKLILILSVLILCINITGIAFASNFQSIDPTMMGSITINRFAGTTADSPTTGAALNGIPYTVELVRFNQQVEQTADNLRNPENFSPISGDGGVVLTGETINGVVSFENLPHGIYRVTEGEHTVTPASDRVAPFIVAIPRRGINDEWVYNVDIYPKTDEDSVVVFVKELDLVWDGELGEMVAQWRLEAVLPRLIGNATRFEFIDELSDNLVFIPGSVTASYQRLVTGGESAEFVQEDVLFHEAFYNYSVNETNVLSIAINQAGLSHLSSNAILAPDGRIVFSFRTRVIQDEEHLGAITNSARLYYNEDEDGLETEIPPTNFLYALEVHKIDVGGNLLSEAIFEIFSDEDAQEPAFLMEGANRQFMTSGGVAFIPGLQAGTYFIREVEAPSGYRLIDGLMEVVISDERTNPERPFVVEVQIVNEVNNGFILPETGGIGTIMLTTTGLALIGGSITLVKIKKRRRKLDE